VKPDNFALGLKNRNIVYLIDYGLAKPYYNHEIQKHIPFCSNKRLTGTVRYASLGAHLGYELSRRDDLEGLGYTLIYLMKGRVPWQGINIRSKHERHEKIKQYKMEISFHILCKGLPEEMLRYMQYCRNLKFDENPNYIALKSIFRNYYYGKKLDLGLQLDWNISDSSEEDQKTSAKVRNVVFLIKINIGIY